LDNLSKELSNAGFKFKEVAKNILLVEDFISKDDIKYIFNIVDKTSNEDWSKHYIENLKGFALQKFNSDDIEKLVEENKLEITSNWHDKNLNIRGNPIVDMIYFKINSFLSLSKEKLSVDGCDVVQRMYSGVELYSHVDQDTDPSIQFASIIYLNDDYIDGEIFFEKLNFQIKPPSGSLLIFPGSSEYHHGVRTVGDGPIRYVLAGFIKIKDFYKNKI